MNIILIFIIIIFSIIISKRIFGKSINPLSIYAFTWGGMIFLYELKLLPYYDLTLTTWLIILGGYLSFVFGILTIYAAKNSIHDGNYLNQFKNGIVFHYLLQDQGKLLKYLLLFFSVIGLLGAIQNWVILFNRFGSIQNILLSANKIYHLRINGNLGTIPYLGAFSLAGIFLSGVYIAYKNKFSFIALIPLGAVLLSSIAQFSRIQMLIGIMEFLIALLFFRYFINRTKEKKIQSNKKLIFILIGILILFISGGAFIKAFRGAYESYKGTSSELYKFRKNIFISPSIYLYLSSNVGVLNKYLQKDDKIGRFGQNTFAPVYNFLAKFDLAEDVPFDEKGYYIPMWTNSGTYLRELYVDFGPVGVFLIPYLLGLITTFFWLKFYQTFSIKIFILLVYASLIIGLSFFSLAMRGADWYISLFVLLTILPASEKLMQNLPSILPQK